MRKMDARRLSSIIMMAALGVVFDAVVTPGFSGGVWYGLIFLMSPIAGIILGPLDGFSSTLIAVMVGHTLNPRDIFEYVFTFGAPVGSLISGYIYRGRVKYVLLYYSILFFAYFLNPVSWYLPVWGMWDTLAVYMLIFVLMILYRKSSFREKFTSNRRLIYAVSALIGLEADILFRIFLFIPCQTYWLFYGFTWETLYAIWAVPAPLITPIKVFISTVFAATLGPTIEKAYRWSRFRHRP